MADTTLLIPNDARNKKKSPIDWANTFALFFSIVAIILGITGFFKKPAISDATVFPFSHSNTVGEFMVGQAVSINREGKLQVGAGTTITKNIYEWKGTRMSRLHTTSLGRNLVVSVYDGHITVAFVNEVGEALYSKTQELPPVGESIRFCDDIRHFANNTIIVLGSNELLPVTIVADTKDATITYGETVRFTEPRSIQPLMDTLSDRCFALSYYYTYPDNNMNISLSTRTGCIDNMKITLTEEIHYSKNYMFHSVAGLSEEYYILAKAVTEDQSHKDIIFQLASIGPNGAVKVGKELILKNRTNFGFFDMDNLNDHQAIVTFIDGNMNNGLQSVLLILQNKQLLIGPYLDNQDGGASGQSDSGAYNYINIRVMSESRFAIFYSNVLNQGATSLCLGEVTPANDLVAVGPEYVISDPMSNSKSQYYWLGECTLFRNRVALMESLADSEDESKIRTYLHLIDVKPLALGIVGQVSSSSVDVVVSGSMKTNIPLEPGHNYYCDSLGNLVMGEYVGLMNTESYYIYVQSKEGKIVSDDNRVGYAIDANTLFLKVHN